MSFPHDRLWRCEKGTVVAGFTDYNWEVTGCAPVLRKWVRKAGGNATYLILALQGAGWIVETVDETTENC